MLKNDKRLIIIAAVLLLIAGAAGAARLLSKPQEPSDGKLGINVWFLNPASNTLEPEMRYIDVGENIDMVQAVFDILRAGPRSNTLTKVYPDSLKWMDAPLIVYDEIMGETYLEIEFSPEYNDMSLWEEQFFRASLVWSVTELGFINDVRIFVDGRKLLMTNSQPLGRLDRSTVAMNPVISPSKVETQRVILYFIDAGQRKLVEEERIILVDPDLPIEKYVVEQIIAGPRTPGLSMSIPSDTKIKGDVRTEEGICYVNLSGDFSSKSTASGELLRLNVYSVVNSLTELTGVNEVQFLIEGERLDNYKGGMDLSKPLGRDESLIAE